MSSSEHQHFSTDKQLLYLSKEYLGKIEGHAERVNAAVGLLDEARKFYEKSSWRNFLEIIKVASPFITILLVYFLMQSQQCGTSIKAAGIEFNKSCISK